MTVTHDAPLDSKRRALLDAVPRWYNGYVHLAFIHISAPAAIIGCLLSVEDVSAAEWMIVPGFFVFANLFEWWIHRGPMHHSTAGLRIVYQRHTREHHALYPAHALHLRSHRELAHVLFPVWFLPFILVVNAPIPLLFAWMGSPNLAWLFFASALAYYLVYEWFHLLHHLPDHSLLTRNRVTRWLRAHHARHHDLRLMTRGNFNVSFPLFDRLLGTLLSPPERDDGAG